MVRNCEDKEVRLLTWNGLLGFGNSLRNKGFTFSLFLVLCGHGHLSGPGKWRLGRESMWILKGDHVVTSIVA